MTHDMAGWGVTGWSIQWGALDPSDDGTIAAGIGYGIIKVVDPGVVYFEPPLIDGLMVWTRSQDGRGRSFTMCWCEDEPPRYRSLTSFYDSLATRRSSLATEDEELRECDRLVLDFVRLVSRLHKAGGTLGFLQPESVLVCHRRDGSSQIVLPDIGFYWDEQHGLREPRWIGEPSSALVFEHGPRRRNADGLQAQRAAAGLDIGKRAAALAEAQAEDTRLIARLIALILAGPSTVGSWCGQGRAFLNIPGRDKAPDTMAPVWDQVIAPALLGHITSCDALATRLEAAPPSGHFLFKPPQPPPWWKKALRHAAPALGGLACLIVAAVAAPFVYAWVFPPCNPHPLCKQVCGSNPLFPLLTDLENGRQRALAAADLDAVTAYWDGLEALEEMPEPCRDALRQECAELADKTARELVESLRRRPRPRSGELELLAQAVTLVARVDAALPGRQSRIGALLNRQVRLRGGKSPRRTAERSSSSGLP